MSKTENINNKVTRRGFLTFLGAVAGSAFLGIGNRIYKKETENVDPNYFEITYQFEKDTPVLVHIFPDSGILEKIKDHVSILLPTDKVMGIVISKIAIELNKSENLNDLGKVLEILTRKFYEDPDKTALEVYRELVGSNPQLRGLKMAGVEKYEEMIKHKNSFGETREEMGLLGSSVVIASMKTSSPGTLLGLQFLKNKGEEVPNSELTSFEGYEDMDTSSIPENIEFRVVKATEDFPIAVTVGLHVSDQLRDLVLNS